jgi:hypothetical protein
MFCVKEKKLFFYYYFIYFVLLHIEMSKAPPVPRSAAPEWQSATAAEHSIADINIVITTTTINIITTITNINVISRKHH